MACRDVVVVGGSAGSGAVLRRFIPALPADFPAAIFVVTHIGAAGARYLVEGIAEKSPLDIGVAVDGQPIELGHAYFAPPDHHMLVFPRVIRLGRGARENMTRPAIDPLFRSAALAFDGRVIGVVVSGFLNDGASGLFAIKQRGGLAVVQHPLEAEAPGMPQAALEACDADYIVSADEIAATLCSLAGQPVADASREPAPDLELEVRIAMGARVGSDDLNAYAEPSRLSCPHCHGVLSEMHAPGPLRYRCQTGHAFTAEAAFAAQQDDVDEALMVALRVMEERVNLVARMGHDARAHGRDALAETYEARAEEYARYAATLRGAAVRSLGPSTQEAAE